MELDVIDSRHMRALETNAEYFGISLLQLMENAGRNVALEISARFKPNRKIAIFCGLGGNGGDGFVLARHLTAMGFKVTVVLVGRSRDISHEAAIANWLVLQTLGDIPILEVDDSSNFPKVEADIVVDALLGTGTKGNLRQPILQAVEYINALTAAKVAIDIPTGIDSDTGEVLGKAVKADVTVTFYKAKEGLKNAKKYVGELIVRDIGLPTVMEQFAGPGDVLLATQCRPLTAHKGDFGRLLVIGGSEVFSGAPTLVSLAALRTGVDLVYTAAPSLTAHDIASVSPDLITVKLEGNHLNHENLPKISEYVDLVDAVVLGPGIGLHAETTEFVKACITLVEEKNKPLLLDADGLKVFAKCKRSLKSPLVVTPHAGEYALLTGKRLPEDMRSRVMDVKITAKELGAIVLLKGHVDIISDGEHVKLNFTGNPCMTVGGTGDVLSGIVGAFLAQKVDTFEAATAGAFVNGAAGDFAVKERGTMMASDLLTWIPTVLNNPMSHVKVRRSRGKNL